MTRDEARRSMVAYWLTKADEALVAADADLRGGHPSFGMNRAYYACFYAASAVLLHEGRTFKRHHGVRDAVHTHFVNGGRLSPAQGRLYDRLFETQLRLDYAVFASIDPAEAHDLFRQAKDLAADLRNLIQTAE
ncbi:MAG: HEPN domain-containing protein [Phycisphaerales bacterium]|nr:HEPN domain-containing protein [Phycisphaerales bacterium]